MRFANIFAIVTIGVWVGMLRLGMTLLKSVVEQGVAGFPSDGQIDFLIGVPVTLIAIVVVSALVVNIANRWWAVLHLVSGAALLALLPCLLIYGGGV